MAKKQPWILQKLPFDWRASQQWSGTLLDGLIFMYIALILSFGEKQWWLFLLQTRNPKYSRYSLISISTMGRCFPSHSISEGKVIAYYRCFRCKRATLSIAEEFPSTDKHLNNSQVPSLTICFLLVISFCIYLAELIKNVDVTPSFLAAFASDKHHWM